MARSTVIKASSIPSGEPLRCHAFRLDDVMREAEQNVAVARAKAVQLVKDAEARAQAIQAAARDEGYRKGHAEGLDRGLREGREKGHKEAFDAASHTFLQQHANLVATFEQAVATIDRDRAHWWAAARQDLVELAMEIARRVVKHVGERDREVVLANLEEAVRLAGVRSEVSIVVNPVDAEAARLFAKTLADMREQWKHVRILEEPEVSAGGCRIQWGTGAVDAALEKQLDRISAELRGQAAAAAPPEGGTP